MHSFAKLQKFHLQVDGPARKFYEFSYNLFLLFIDHYLFKNCVKLMVIGRSKRKKSQDDITIKIISLHISHKLI